jgi:hypothetical protein
MTKEYHIFTTQEANFEQGFIFEIDRDSNPQYISLNELWIVSVKDEHEIKTRINLREMIKNIGNRIGGNVEEEGMSKIVEIFSDLLPPEKQLEIRVDMCEQEINKSDNTSEQLLKAAEYAEKIHSKENPDLSIMIDNILLKRLQDDRKE